MSEEMRERITVCAVLVVVFAAVLLGNMIWHKTPEDIMVSAREYCANVHSGKWRGSPKAYAQRCWPDGTVNQSYINAGGVP